MLNESGSLRRLFNERLVKEEVRNEEKGEGRREEEEKKSKREVVE